MSASTEPSAPAGGPSTSRTRPRASRRSTPLLGFFLFFAFLSFLLYRQCSVSAVGQAVGRLYVSAAITPNPPAPGPALLHVQLGRAEDRAPVRGAGLRVELRQPGGESRELPATMKATDGAYEVPLELPSTGAVEVVLRPGVEGHEEGSLRLRIQVGQPLEPITADSP